MVLTLAGGLGVGLVLGWMVARRLRSPRLALLLGATGSGAALGVAMVAVATPIVHGTPAVLWPVIFTDYVLAMTHQIIPTAAYPFFWRQSWVYSTGSWLLLMPFGAGVGVAGGAFGWPTQRRLAGTVSGLALSLLLAYSIVGWWAVAQTWQGIPV
ncbi:MAG TPA: hypothetical protein VF160_04405 [Candidatus Dormibacteraeota bacterium]